MIQSITQANQIIQKQQAQIEQLVSELTSSQRKINTLQHQVEQLLRRIYGRKSEKMDRNQLMFESFMLQGLGLNRDIEKPTPPVQKKKKSGSRQKFGRIPIPEHLERIEILLDIPEEQKVCKDIGLPLKHVGDKISENSSTGRASS